MEELRCPDDAIVQNGMRHVDAGCITYYYELRAALWALDLSGFLIEVVTLLLFFLLSWSTKSSKVVEFVQRACRCLKTTHGRFMVHKPWSYWRFDI